MPAISFNSFDLGGINTLALTNNTFLASSSGINGVGFASFAAGGTNQGSATQVSHERAAITAGTLNQGVRLPFSNTCLLYNKTGTTIKLYPSGPGGSINLYGSITSSIDMANNTYVLCYRYSDADWIALG
jgi:hypothetical protein